MGERGFRSLEDDQGEDGKKCMMIQIDEYFVKK